MRRAGAYSAAGELLKVPRAEPTTTIYIERDDWELVTPYNRTHKNSARGIEYTTRSHYL